jgi:DNA-binding XRE family transcriptional regulator
MDGQTADLSEDKIADIANMMMGDMYMRNFMLKANRIKAGLSEEGIARALHMTKKYYINIENNSVSPRLKDMVKISGFLGFTIDELFDWENPSVCNSVCGVVREGGFEPPQALTL